MSRTDEALNPNYHDDTQLRVFRGAYRFETKREAVAWAIRNGWGKARIWLTESGWVVQAGPSGNYAGPDDPKPKRWRGYAEFLRDGANEP